MKKILPILLFLLPTLSKAQPNLPKPVADSLWAVWSDPQHPDTMRLKALYKYTWDGYIRTKPDSAFYFASLQYEFAEQTGLKNQMALALNTQGVSYYFIGYYSDAMSYFVQCLRIREEVGDKQGIAASLNNIGMTFKDQGHFEQSMNYFLKSVKIKEELGDKHGVANSLSNIGLIYKDQGAHAEAIEYFRKSYAIHNELNNQKGIAGTLNNIGIIYLRQGDFPQAEICFTQSHKILERIGDYQGIAISLGNFGQIYMDEGDYVKSLDYQTQSLKIRKELNNKQGIAASLGNISSVYIKQDSYDKALEYSAKSLLILEEIGNKQGVSESLKNIGLIYSGKGDSAILNGNFFVALEKYSQALHYGLRALSIAQGVGAALETKNAIHSLILPYVRLDSTSSAAEMVNLLESLRLKDLDINFSILSELEKEKYFATMQSDFDILFDFAIHHSQLTLHASQSYNNALLTKGLTLKSSQAMRFAIQNSGDTTLINQYEEWLSLKRKISKLNETDSTYKTLTNQANEMERELVKNSIIFNDFDKVKNLKWQDVQAGLKPNEAAIEFIHFKSEIAPIAIGAANPIIYAALIVRKDSKNPEMIRLCTEADLKEILGVFQGNNLSFVNKVYGTKSKAEKALYEKIWQPLEKHLDGIQNIYYSPTGLLHKVSFAAISKNDNVYLCDNYQLYQQSSTGKVALPTNVLYDATDAFLLVGGVQYNGDKTKREVWSYLPGTKTETEHIQSFLKKKKHVVNYYAANDASEDNFKAQASKANVLHISTHGFFYPDPEQVREEAKKEEIQEENIIFRGVNDPIAIGFDSAERSSSLYANWSFVINQNPLMRSGLVLAGANDVWQRNALEEGEDGILTAQEVSNLDLRNTKLVVLSACETGLGDIKGSEGVFGLQRAFKIAGAQYLIMSLWQVPDKETAEFMQLF